MSEQQKHEEIEAKKRAEEEKESKLLQRTTLLVMGLALTIILVVGLILPLRDSLTLNAWLERANAEGQAIIEEIPGDLAFTDAEYDSADRTLVLYAYFVVDSNPLPARTEVGRVPLPKGAGLNTFVNARSLRGGVIFARKLSSGSAVPDWEGLYINDSGLNGLDEYVLREVGENAWYLLRVPQGLQ